MNRSLLSMSFAPRRHRTQTAFMLPDPKFFAGVLLHVDGKSDRWRSEVMLMVRIDDPARKELPFAGFHLAQSWQPWHSLGGQGRLRVAVWHRIRRPRLPLWTRAATRSEP